MTGMIEGHLRGGERDTWWHDGVERNQHKTRWWNLRWRSILNPRQGTEENQWDGQQAQVSSFMPHS